jgi:hypothetical protein
MTSNELEQIADKLYDRFVDPESPDRSILALAEEILSRPKEVAVWLAIHIAASLDHEDSEALYEAVHGKIK